MRARNLSVERRARWSGYAARTASGAWRRVRRPQSCASRIIRRSESHARGGRRGVPEPTVYYIFQRDDDLGDDRRVMGRRRSTGGKLFAHQNLRAFDPNWLLSAGGSLR